MYNIITADREKEESICSQDLPLQPDALNASILSVYLKSVLYILSEDFSNTLNISDMFVLKRHRYLLQSCSNSYNSLWYLRVNGE